MNDDQTSLRELFPLNAGTDDFMAMLTTSPTRALDLNASSGRTRLLPPLPATPVRPEPLAQRLPAYAVSPATSPQTMTTRPTFALADMPAFQPLRYRRTATSESTGDLAQAAGAVRNGRSESPATAVARAIQDAATARAVSHPLTGEYQRVPQQHVVVTEPGRSHPGSPGIAKETLTAPVPSSTWQWLRSLNEQEFVELVAPHRARGEEMVSLTWDEIATLRRELTPAAAAAPADVERTLENEEVSALRARVASLESERAALAARAEAGDRASAILRGQRLDELSDTTIRDLQASLEAELTRRSLCVVCFERPARTFFYPCRHQVCCAVCSEPMSVCPVCRAGIREKLQPFTTAM